MTLKNTNVGASLLANIREQARSYNVYAGFPYVASGQTAKPTRCGSDPAASVAIDSQSLSGGHFFATQHTLDRYEDAFYTPLVSDWSNYETWQESGARTTAQRANTIWKQLLREYQQPELDAGIDEVLENYVARRKREISAKS